MIQLIFLLTCFRLKKNSGGKTDWKAWFMNDSTKSCIQPIVFFLSVTSKANTSTKTWATRKEQKNYEHEEPELCAFMAVTLLIHDFAC